MKTVVIVTLQVEGIHHWLGAAGLPEVVFLAHPHRHLFHVKCEKLVSHADRDVEIIMLKRDIISHLYHTYADGYGVHQFGQRSCEMLATELAEQFGLISCEVLEDGENGARVEI